MRLFEIKRLVPSIFDWTKQFAGPNRYTHVGGPNGIFSRKNPHYYGPVGTYAYDLNVALKENNSNDAFIRKISQVASQGLDFLYILESTSKNTLFLGKYTKDQYQKDLKKVLAFFEQKCGKPRYYKDYLEKHTKYGWDKNYLATLDVLPWDDPKNIVDTISSIAGSSREDGCVKNYNIVTNYILRQVLGYDAVRDAPGQSNISLEDYEPDQIVFLINTAYKILDVYPKPITTQRTKSFNST